MSTRSGWASLERSRSRIVLGVVVGIMLAGVLGLGGTAAAAPNARAAAAQAMTVYPAAAASLGAIPDGLTTAPASWGAPRNVTFSVAGAPGVVTDVSVSFSIAHTFVGDVEATLIAPGGQSRLLFSRTGSSTPSSNGSGSDLVCCTPYVFADTGVTNWWTNAATNPVPAGTFKPTVSGPTSTPAATTTFAAVFDGVAPNGTWTLRFRDGASSDVGTVSAANLTVTTDGTTPSNARVDYDGNGTSDWAIVRNNAGLLNWWVKRNADTMFVNFGVAGDIPIDGDFDGDGISDVTVWRPSTGVFFVRRSTDLGVTVQQFGISTDVPLSGDFDGDGKSDFAVYREASSPGGQSQFWVKRSTTGTDLVTGFGTQDDIPVPDDYDGDGKTDAAVRRGGAFHLLRSTSGYTVINWGIATDKVYPGDLDADGKGDLTILRVVGGSYQWWTALSSLGYAGFSISTFGFATDTPAPGDYNGDGRTDRTVFRNSTGQWYSQSPATNVTTVFSFGIATDTPVTANLVR